MVYRGKPSPRCGRCRSRALKCSQEKPSCSQCIRAHVECPGYRDLRSLLFLDESEDVSRKVENQQAIRHRTSKHGHSLRGGRSEEYRIRKSVKSGLSVAMHEQALCFMHQNYLQNWLWLYGDDTLQKDEVALTSAITALGLSAMANMRMSPPLMLAAREEYIKALSATNKGITDPYESKTDHILMAVMFLGMFEVVTFNDAESIYRWMKHIQGAAKLLEWRGEEQLSSPRGLHLFRLMRTQIILHNIFQESHTSPIIVALCEKACNLEEPTSGYADEFARLTIQLSSLCANIKKGIIDDPAARISLALALDAEMEAWAARIPSDCRYETLNFPAESHNQISCIIGTYGNEYHTYKNLFSCAVWNNWRTARMVIHEIILDDCNLQIEADTDTRLSTQPFTYSSVATRSRRILISMIEDVCASVPYHFGISKTPSHIDSANINGIGIAAGHVLFWPLFEAADCEVASPQLKSWAIMCLEKIGHGMGISQALAMANLVREGMGSRTWIKPEVTVTS